MNQFNSFRQLNTNKNSKIIVINTSNNYDNYRHSTNSLLMYNTLKENGIPDEHVK